MKHKVTLTVTSLLSLLFMTFHLTHDVIRQAEGANTYPIPVLVFALWLYGTLMLSLRRKSSHERLPSFRLRTRL